MAKKIVGSYWNYRVVRRNHRTKPPCTTFGIYEAHYDSEDRVCAITRDPVAVDADSLAQIKKDLKGMVRALKAPVLDYDKIPEPGTSVEVP